MTEETDPYVGKTAGPEVRELAGTMRGLDAGIREMAETGRVTVGDLGTLRLYAERIEEHYTPAHPAYERVQANAVAALRLAAMIEPLLEGCAGMPTAAEGDADGFDALDVLGGAAHAHRV